ncbi:beta-lactamase family protein [Parvularcula sp. BGMRC 0090]|uniref:Beta-lactamase family protein n=1 Tax=Parvularcula maris TaxID=2965077 RepID=A0A9X2LBB3_9PROT|nr:beta-lactamase family protein [Parvularcula maris]
MFFLLIAALGSAALWWWVYRDRTDPPRFEAADFAGLSTQEAAQRIADATVAGGAPGVLIHVRTRDETVTVVAGISDRKSGAPMPKEAPLRIGSISKIYTAAAVHHLIDQGRFDLETRIADLLPRHLIEGVPNADRATVRQLLQHTSGIPNYYDVRSYFTRDWTQPISLQAMLPTVRRMKATHPPGERYAYSNTGYLYLGAVVEEASGQPLDEVLGEVIRTPLKLEATYYNRFDPADEAVYGYGTYLRPWKNTYAYWEHSGPDGGIAASAQEVAVFLEGLLGEEAALRHLGDRMTAELIERAPRRRQGLGIETIVTRSGEELYGHTGDVFGYQTIAHYYPERGAAVVAHVNCNCASLTSSLIGNLYRAVEATDGVFAP